VSAPDLLDHLANFVAPAFFVALVLASLARLFMPKRPAAQALWADVAINFVVGVAALAVGLAWFGRDGTMTTYGVMVLACATAQWALSRGWRG
jgi:hypothetical protein